MVEYVFDYFVDDFTEELNFVVDVGADFKMFNSYYLKHLECHVFDHQWVCSRWFVAWISNFLLIDRILFCERSEQYYQEFTTSKRTTISILQNGHLSLFSSELNS